MLVREAGINITGEKTTTTGRVWNHDLDERDSAWKLDLSTFLHLAMFEL